MKTTLYYFTGTGNSLKVAKDISRNLGDSECVSIPKALEQNEKIEAPEVVGIVCPKYYFGLPEIVLQFIDKVNLDKTKYIFAVVTFAKGLPGGALSQLRKALALKSKRLSSGFYVRMVDNFILWTWDVTSEKKHGALHKNAEIKAGKIAEIVAERGNKFDKSLMEHIGPVLFNYKGFLKEVNAGDTDFYSTEKCNSCGLCAKVCSVKNIKMADGKPEWLGLTCQRCLACLHLCPQKCVQFGEQTKKRSRYVNPFIKISELINGD